MKKISKSIVLVGMMGCGKSSVGKLLSAKLGMEFIDLDSYIENIEEISISEIFSKYGEKYFREKEKESINKLIEGSPKVIALGGGAFIQDEIRKIVKEKAITIWIRADKSIILERVLRKNSRPLLENVDKAAMVEKLIKERYPIYAEADIVVDTTTGPCDIVVEMIAEII